MYLTAFMAVLCMLVSDATLEATGGLALPGSPESDTPALDIDFRMITGEIGLGI